MRQQKKGRTEYKDTLQVFRLLDFSILQPREAVGQTRSGQNPYS